MDLWFSKQGIGKQKKIKKKPQNFDKWIFTLHLVCIMIFNLLLGAVKKLCHE